MSAGMEESELLFQTFLSEYTTLGSFWPISDTLANHGPQASRVMPAAQEEIVVGKEQGPMEVRTPLASESGPRCLLAATVELGLVGDLAFDNLPSSDNFPSSDDIPSSDDLPTTSNNPCPSSGKLLGTSTGLVPTTSISKMRNKAIIVELKNDYLVPSWAVEGKRIQRQMLRDPVLAKRKLEEKRKFVKGHEPMSRGNMIRLLEQCREGPKRDMSIGTLQGILTDLGLFTDEQWSLFNREMKAGLIPRRKPR